MTTDDAGRREALNRAVGTMLAEEHHVFGHSGQDKGASLRDFRALTDDSNQLLNDRTVRVQFEGNAVVSVYVLRPDTVEGVEALMCSARFVQMPPDTIARVIAAEMVGTETP